MGETTNESKCGAEYLIEPKEEIVDDLVITDNCEDDIDVLIPKEELSNSSVHLDDDMNEQNPDMVMPIKTELTLCDNIAEVRRQYESSKLESVSDKDANTEHTMMEIKIEPERYMPGSNRDYNIEQDAPLLKKYLLSPYGSAAVKNELPSSNVCEKQFQYRSDLGTDISKKLHSCDLCPRKYTSRRSLAYHKRSHTGERPFSCELCLKRFTCKSSLTAHTRIHNGEKLYSCDICQAKFTKRSNLKQHAKTHTGERPYTCNVCEGTFTEKCSLTTHMRTHTGDKPYACELCPMRYSDRSSLNYHIRTHTGDKPFTCELCPMKYRDKSSLSYHMRSHTGYKMYSCEVCEKKYTTKPSLSRHMITHSDWIETTF